MLKYNLKINNAVTRHPTVTRTTGYNGVEDVLAL